MTAGLYERDHIKSYYASNVLMRVCVHLLQLNFEQNTQVEESNCMQRLSNAGSLCLTHKLSQMGHKGCNRINLINLLIYCHLFTKSNSTHMLSYPKNMSPYIKSHDPTHLLFN